VVDYLSKFGYVQPLKKRSAKEVGDALIGIICSRIMPRILQSDNGAEVSFLCILITTSSSLLIVPTHINFHPYHGPVLRLLCKAD
jgi:hypothetical protein